jgi:hypothetical protein
MLVDALLGACHPSTTSIGRASEEPTPGTLARTPFPSTTSSHRHSHPVNAPAAAIIPFHAELWS